MTLTAQTLNTEYETLYTGLVGYAARLLKNWQAAEDVVADTWVRAVESLSQFAGRGTPRSWLYSICHRLCLDRMRHAKVVRRLEPVVVEMEGRRVGTSPEGRVDARMKARRLNEAIHALPDSHRRVIELRVLQGRSAKDAAGELGVSPHQVDSRLSYARRCLKAAVG